MKKTIVTCALVACFAFAYASEVPTEDRVLTNVELIQQSTEIEYSELPKAVQTAFSEAYSKESVESVHEMEVDGVKEYKITITESSQKWALKYDAKGKLLDTKKVN